MTQKTEKFCGSFAGVTQSREIKKVVVIQEALSYYGKEKNYSKTFRQEDGALLKRTHR